MGFLRQGKEHFANTPGITETDLGTLLKGRSESKALVSQNKGAEEYQPVREWRTGSVARWDANSIKPAIRITWPGQALHTSGWRKDGWKAASGQDVSTSPNVINLSHRGIFRE